MPNQMQISGPLALLAYPFIKRRERQQEQEINDLLAGAYTGDTEKLKLLAAKRPELITGIIKLKEFQREQQAYDRFIRTVEEGVKVGGIPQLNLDYAELLTSINRDMTDNILTGGTPSPQPKFMPEITETPAYTRPLTDEEIRQAMIMRNATTGNWSELSGVNYLSQARTEDFERQQKQEKWKQIQDEIETIRRGNEVPATPGMTIPNPLYVNGIDIGKMLTGVPSMPITMPGQPARREDLSPQQLAKSSHILNALGVNTGNITGGQLDLARIREIEQGKGETSDFQRKVDYLESIGKTPDEIVELVYKPTSKEGAEKFTKDVREFVEINGRKPANMQEFLSYLKQKTVATQKGTDKDSLTGYQKITLAQKILANDTRMTGDPETDKVIIELQAVLGTGGQVEYTQEDKAWARQVLNQVTGNTSVPETVKQQPAAQPEQGTAKPKTATDFLKLKGLLR